MLNAEALTNLDSFRL